MDTRYPEPLSNIYKRANKRKMHRGNGARYRTQAVTFSEIREVDEENMDDSGERRAEREGALGGNLQRSRSLEHLSDGGCGGGGSEKLESDFVRLSRLKLTRLEDTRQKNRIINDLIKTSNSLLSTGDADGDPEPEPEDYPSGFNLEEEGTLSINIPSEMEIKIRTGERTGT